MRIDVAELEIGEVRRATFDEVVDSRTEDVRFDAPVNGDVEVNRTARTVHLRGRVATTVPLVCGRCLEPFRQGIAVVLVEESVVGGAPPAGEGVVGPDLVLDVTEAVRQQLLLALPMVPVCRPDCRGLCPQCGTNLNERECGCVPGDVIDPRLAPLLKLESGNEGTREPGNAG